MTEPSIFNETFDEVRFIDSFGKSTFSYQTPTQAKEVSYPRGEEYKVYEHIAYVEYDRKVINPKDFNTTVVDLASWLSSTRKTSMRTTSSTVASTMTVIVSFGMRWFTRRMSLHVIM